MILASCDIYSDISDLRDGSYMLTETDMKVGVGAVRPAIVSSVYSRAQEFCELQNGEMQKIDDDTEGASLGKFAFYTLKFRCD